MIKLYHQQHGTSHHVATSRMSWPIMDPGTDGDMADAIREATFHTRRASTHVQALIDDCEWWGLDRPTLETLPRLIRDDDLGAEYRARLAHVLTIA